MSTHEPADVASDRRASGPRVDYDAPETYHNLDGASRPVPIQNYVEGQFWESETREEPIQGSSDIKDLQLSRSLSTRSAAREQRNARRRSSAAQVEYDVPGAYANLGELTDVSPIQNPDERPIYRHRSLEQVRSRDQEHIREERERRSLPRRENSPKMPKHWEKEMDGYTRYPGLQRRSAQYHT